MDSESRSEELKIEFEAFEPGLNAIPEADEIVGVEEFFRCHAAALSHLVGVVAELLHKLRVDLLRFAVARTADFTHGRVSYASGRILALIKHFV